MFKSALLLILAAASVHAAPTAAEACADVTVIFARGTGETPPIGTIVGPPFEGALQAALGSRSLSFQGVNYPANVAGFLEGGDPNGAATMAQDISSTASSCPNTKIVVSGYSQGGQLVHLAAKQLSSAVQSRVNAIVIFGDPDNGQPFPGNLNAVEKTFCAVGDDICAGGDVILPAHLSYGADAGAAASFVVSKL
ncbi:Cutinase [Psilocybe cubensis]|uniref:Cutinase n=2 Tax=Psilocybe cubensis TaxID=181762 RepID=A0A8H7Y1S1_PSICU|nr:Cutinase [Psilocybe cubensis]KAH9484512.1 Cutinase [Psilocybe cubensis]